MNKKICPLCEKTISGDEKVKYLCTNCNVILNFKMIGLFLGRFQPFHKGHLEVIRRASSEVEKLIIVIGSSLKHDTKENPFSADERKEMIEKSLEEAHIDNCIIVAVNDILVNDEYVNHVKQFTPPFNIVYSCQNKLTEKLFGEAGFKTKTYERFFDINATEIRDRMIKDQNWQSLVPKPVSEYLESIKGVVRVKKLFVH